MGTGHSTVVCNDETFGTGGNFKVHIKLFEGFDPEERRKLRQACRDWAEVWQSSAFKQWLLEFQFEGTDLTNEQIFDKLMGGVSAVNIVDNQADIEIWAAQSENAENTLNTTFLVDGKEWEGSPFLTSFSVAKIAGYLAYDYCRNQGFLHAGIAPTRTVPFAVACETKRLIEQTAPLIIAQSTSVKSYKEEEVAKQTE